MIAGNGARNAGACDLLHEFRDKTKIPVLTSMNAADLMQDEEKYLTDAKDFMLDLIDEEIPRYDE